jgi:hypothetical protein
MRCVECYPDSIFTGGDIAVVRGVRAGRNYGQDQPYSDGEGSFLTSYGISDSGAILVRPDGFSVWRAQNAAAQLVTPDEIFLGTLFVDEEKSR